MRPVATIKQPDLSDKNDRKESRCSLKKPLPSTQRLFYTHQSSEIPYIFTTCCPRTWLGYRPETSSFLVGWAGNLPTQLLSSTRAPNIMRWSLICTRRAIVLISFSQHFQVPRAGRNNGQHLLAPGNPGMDKDRPVKRERIG